MNNQTVMSVARYFLAVILVSIPLWLAGSLSGWEPLPGVPISAAMAFLPGPVAFVLVARVAGVAGAVRWFKSALRADAPGSRSWMLVAVLAPPAIMLVTYLVMFVAGYNLPEPELDVVQLCKLLLIFMVPALLEEIGWSGYAVHSLQRQMSALAASLIVGLVWSAWHFVPLLQVGRTIEWIAWWTLTTIALRILITWIYNSSAHSCLAAAFAHASENVSWQAFPNNGSHYDPVIHAVVFVIAVTVIIAIFGKTALKRPIPS